MDELNEVDEDDEVGEVDDIRSNFPDGVAAQVWEEEEAMGLFEDSRLAIRMAVAVCFQSSLQSPPREEWAGKNGTVSHICEVFNFPKKNDEWRSEC